jgi:hypothetical protein
MRAELVEPREKAKISGVRTVPSKGQNVRHILPFEAFLREIWPQDRTKNYMRVTGATMRTAKRRIAGNHPPDYLEIAAILRSEHGYRFLQHIMGDERPRWFSGVERAKQIGDMRRQAADHARRIAQLEMLVD